MGFAPQQERATGGGRLATPAAIAGAACNPRGEAVIGADVAVVEVDNGKDGGGNGGADDGAEPAAAAASATPAVWADAASIFSSSL